MILKKLFKIDGANGKPITGDYTYDDNNTIKASIIFVHGFKGFKDWGAHNLVAARFAANGYRYIKFNLSHSGVTDENPDDVTDMETFAANTISKELYDTEAVIGYTATNFPGLPVYLIGHSRGGGLSIIIAQRNPAVSKLITWSSISDFSSLWKKEQEKEWMHTGKIYVINARTHEKMPLNNTLLYDYRQNKTEFDIMAAAERISIPWLILHGDNDVNVDFSVAQQLAQKQLKARIQKIEGANHVYGAFHPYTSSELPEQLQLVVEKTIAFISH